MNPRTTFILCAVDVCIWAVIALLLLTSGSDPATSGLDTVGVIAATALLAITALPALLLARAGRYPKTARALALGFPAAFVLLLVAVAASLP